MSVQREPIAVRTACGLWLRKEATTGVMRGDKFAVVWAAWPEDRGEGVPWPVEDVVALEEQPEALTRDQYFDLLSSQASDEGKAGISDGE